MSAASYPGGPPPSAAAVHLIGVGPGPVDLLTVQASRLISMSGTCLYARSQVPSEALALCPPTARVVDTSSLTSGQALAEIRDALDRGDRVVNLYAGDPLQHDEVAPLTSALAADGISWGIVPGIPHPSLPAARGLISETDARVEGSGETGRAARKRASSATSDPGQILILGGTGEARRLADLLVTAGLDVVTSLAGSLARPRLPRGEVRIGDFGGEAGIARWIQENSVTAVIDATGPFARKISAEATRAAAATGVALLRLERPRWKEADGDEWIRVPDLQTAVAVVRERYRRPMLTVGKHGASAFASDPHGSYLIRCSEPPSGSLPHRYLLVLDRGPFGVDSERTVMARHRIDVLVTRDTGGQATAAKLEAARALRIPVVMIDRPQGPVVGGETMDGATGPETVPTVQDAARWLVGRFGSR